MFSIRVPRLTRPLLILLGGVLALAGLGLLVNERAGVLNLGAEGMMLVGALAGYATALHLSGGWMFVAYLAAAGAIGAPALTAGSAAWPGRGRRADRG